MRSRVYDRPIAYGLAFGIGIACGLAPIHPLEKANRTINLSRVEILDSLPYPVKAVAKAAVAIRTDRLLASGVRIGHDTFLTAGHALLPSETTTKIDCEGAKAIAINPTRKLGSVVFEGASAAAIRNGKQDYGIVTTAPNHAAGANKVPTVAVPDRYKNHLGEEVFLIDYQPIETSSGDDLRSPDVKTKKKDVGTERDRTTPAIIGGIVIKEDTEFIDVLTGINKNYSTGAPDVAPRNGGSGGEVVTKNGELLGALSGSTGPDVLHLPDLLAQYSVTGDLPHHVGDSYDVASIQKITQQHIAALPPTQQC